MTTCDKCQCEQPDALFFSPGGHKLKTCDECRMKTFVKKHKGDSQYTEVVADYEYIISILKTKREAREKAHREERE